MPITPPRPLRVAVIPTRDRPTELADCVDSLRDQCDHIIIVSNGAAPDYPFPPHVWVISWPEQPPNISRLWNKGIEEAADFATVAHKPRWWVGVFNDDVIVPAGWWNAVADAMDATGAVAGSSCQFGHLTAPLLKTEFDTDLTTRMTGFGFMLRGEAGMTLNESLVWWFGDDDLDMRARQNGGTVIVPGYPLTHRHPNETTTGTLAEQAGRDHATFAQIWGRTRW